MHRRKSRAIVAAEFCALMRRPSAMGRDLSSPIAGRRLARTPLKRGYLPVADSQAVFQASALSSHRSSCPRERNRHRRAEDRPRPAIPSRTYCSESEMGWVSAASGALSCRPSPRGGTRHTNQDREVRHPTQSAIPSPHETSITSATAPVLLPAREHRSRLMAASAAHSSSVVPVAGGKRTASSGALASLRRPR